MNFLLGVEAEIVLVLPFVAFFADIFNFGHPDVPANCCSPIQKITVEEFVLWVKVILGQSLLICFQMGERNRLPRNSIKCISGGDIRVFVERRDRFQLRVKSWSRLSEQNLRVDKWSVCRV
jgi:hypothetical protein